MRSNKEKTTEGNWKNILSLIVWLSNFSCFWIERLLLQMRKKRKTRNSKKDASDCTDSTALEIAEKTEARETESDESDEQQISDVSDSELDINNYYFLQVKDWINFQCLSPDISLFFFSLSKHSQWLPDRGVLCWENQVLLKLKLQKKRIAVKYAFRESLVVVHVRYISFSLFSNSYLLISHSRVNMIWFLTSNNRWNFALWFWLIFYFTSRLFPFGNEIRSLGPPINIH